MRNAMRLKEIIDSIANMDNVERGVASVRSQPISIKHIVQEVREAFQEEADKKGVALRTDTGEDDLIVEGDATKINIALSNLVKNAIAFTNSGSHVVIVAGTIPGYIKVSVIDSDIEKIIDDSSLNNKIKELSRKIFMKIATAEASVHGISIDHVHFHEVGAIRALFRQ